MLFKNEKHIRHIWEIVLTVVRLGQNDIQLRGVNTTKKKTRRPMSKWLAKRDFQVIRIFRALFTVPTTLLSYGSSMQRGCEMLIGISSM